MRMNKLICWLLFFWINSFWLVTAHADVTYINLESVPDEVEISGIFRPDDGSTINGVYSTSIQFYTLDQSVPTISYTEDVNIYDNFFRFNLSITDTLESMLNQVESLYVSLVVDENISAILPIASIPYALKSAYAEEGVYSYDDDVFMVDYEHYRIGVGTSNPQEALSVSGTVNITEFYFGDGSELTDIGWRGENNYNYLDSSDGQFSAIVTVNVDGDVMIGGLSNDLPVTDLHVFGSLLIDETNSYDTEMISGRGSRFMWFSGMNLLRIGYVPSYYWDQEYSGDFSIAFGHSTIAKGEYAIITGGFYNHVMDDYSIISGGYQNSIFDTNSVILGGQDNVIESNNSVILGGAQNLSSDYGVILGGSDNIVYGTNSIVVGDSNAIYGDGSVIMGGQGNVIHSDNSVAFGSDITISHDNSVVFNFTPEEQVSTTEGHIQIFSENGMGINTNETFSDGLTVSGKVLADNFVGDGSLITNVLSEQSLWQQVPGYSDLLYIEDLNMGIFNESLLESLNVSGSIHLIGEGSETIGTLRYFEDDFQVYTASGWQSLTISDTNTEYFVKDDLKLSVEDNVNTFYIVTDNATVGNVLQWNGDHWGAGSLDQFEEVPLDAYSDNLELTKRLYLDSGNISIGTSAVVTDTVYVVSDTNTAGFLFHNPDDSDIISFSVNPMGAHFQSFYNDYAQQINDQNVAGQEWIDGQLVYYVAQDSNRVDMLSLSESQIVIGPDVDQDSIDYPFYVFDSLGTESFIFGTDISGVFVRLKEYYDLNDEESIVLYQNDSGELYIQSGPKSYSGDIIFQQSGNQIAKLQTSSSGVTKFGMSDSYVRAAFDVRRGNIHVTDTYGIGFYYQDQKKSEIKFDSTNLDSSIQFFTSNLFSTPNMSISVTGNIGINSEADSRYDVFVQHPSGVDSEINLMTEMDVTASIQFQYDEDSDGDVSNNGEMYSIYFGSDYMWLEGASGVDSLTFSQGNYVGIFDDSPYAELTFSSDIALINQHAIYFKESDQVTSIAGIQGGDTPIIYSTDDISLKSLNNTSAININSDGLALNGVKTELNLDGYDLDFEVNGSVVIDGDIYDQNGDKIFPLMVRNLANTKSETTVNVINIDTDSGFILENDGFDAYVTAPGFYDAILMPNGDLLEAGKNTDLRFIGRGVTVESDNIASQGSFNSLTYDKLTLINDIISGGAISGPLTVIGNFVVLNYISGNGSLLRDVPYRWQKVTENVVVDGVTEVHGDVYYDKGNVGIFTNDPSASLHITGTMHVDDLLIGDGLAVSNFVSTENISFTSNGGMEFDSDAGDVIFNRDVDDEFMRITDSSQWLIGTPESDSLVALYNPEDSDLEFKLDSNLYSYIDFKTNLMSASIRFDDTGSRFDHDFGSDFPNVQLVSESDIGFFVEGDAQSLFLGDDANVGIFQPSPKNILDINGNMSIGYSSDYAPASSLIIDGYLSFATSDIDYPLTVMGHALVGEIENLTSSYDNTFFAIFGDGTYPLLIGSERLDADELIFVNGNMSIKEGHMSIRNGQNDAVLIDRDETSNNEDTIEQLSSTSSLISFYGGNQLIVRSFDGSNWNDQVIVDDNQLGIGGEPTASYPFIVEDTTSSKVKFQSSSTATLQLKNSGANAILGTNDSGFHINTGSTTFTNPDLTVDDNKVGINQSSPDDAYDLDVNGITNASNYYIYDTISQNYEEFETVPSGVIIIWLQSSIPDGWALCNGTGTYTDPQGVTRDIPNLNNSFIVSYGSDYSVGDSGGSREGEMSLVTHSHNSASHTHDLSSGSHTHELSFNNSTVNLSNDSSNAYATDFSAGNNSHTNALASSGSHDHGTNNFTHTHNNQTTSSTEGGHTHATSASNSHSHSHVDSSGNQATHGHSFDNEPAATVVQFIIKVDESL